MGGCYLLLRERLAPDAGLEHVAVEAATEHERCVVEDGLGRAELLRWVGHLFCAGKEADGIALVVIDHGDARELAHRLQLLGVNGALVAGEVESPVGCDAEGGGVVARSVREEDGILVRLGRLNEHVDADGFVREVTIDLGGGVASVCAVEVQRGACCDAGLVGHALEAEVVVLVQVVAGNRLREAELEVVTHAEDAVRRFGVTEDDRRTRILDAADDGRSLVDEARAVSAEADGTQVVLLLHRVALAVEAEGCDTAVDDLLLAARSLIIEAVAGIERAQVHPHVLRLGGELVLELDMIEVLVPDVEAVNFNGHVVTGRVAL